MAEFNRRYLFGLAAGLGAVAALPFRGLPAGPSAPTLGAQANSAGSLTMTLEEYSVRIMQPAMAVMARNIEADVMADLARFDCRG